MRYDDAHSRWLPCVLLVVRIALLLGRAVPYPLLPAACCPPGPPGFPLPPPLPFAPPPLSPLPLPLPLPLFPLLLLPLFGCDC